MASLFKEVRPTDGPLARINILSPATPFKAGEPLFPCRLAANPVEVRGWSRPGQGEQIKRTSASGDLWRKDEEDGADELVLAYALVEDDLGKADSVSAQHGTACVKWTFSDVDPIGEPGTYYFVVKIMDGFGKVIGEIVSGEIVVEEKEGGASG